MKALVNSGAILDRISIEPLSRRDNGLPESVQTKLHRPPRCWEEL